MAVFLVLSSRLTSFRLLISSTLLPTGWSGGDGIVHAVLIGFGIKDHREHAAGARGTHDAQAPVVRRTGYRFAVADLLHLVRCNGVKGNMGNIAWIPNETADDDHRFVYCSTNDYKVKRVFEILSQPDIAREFEKFIVRWVVNLALGRDRMVGRDQRRHSHKRTFSGRSGSYGGVSVTPLDGDADPLAAFPCLSDVVLH